MFFNDDLSTLNIFVSCKFNLWYKNVSRLQVKGRMEERFRKFVPLDKSRKDVRNMAVDIQKQVRYSNLLRVVSLFILNILFCFLIFII